ncbi:hypothetical protein GCM10023188_18000 [Pontibacter saemangeumensis]|uniref:DUF3826 domain-containing protein n=1 Tax=Pontibacter saemangeumensis TaxID=1084525 RepID=A0ABP8LKS9_9BACT
MLKKIQISFLALAFPLLFSCNSGGNDQAAKSDAAYTEYRDLVTDFEEDTLSEVELRAMRGSDIDSARWAALTAEREQQYEQKRQAVEQDLDQYPPERKQEIQDLDDRYKRAMETREKQYEEASHRYKLRQQLLGIEIEEDDLSDIVPEEMATTYKRFVDNVAEEAGKFEERDWNLVEGWWSSLGSRYRSIEPNLDQQARTAIEQAQNRYKEIRQQYASQNNLEE